MSSRRKNNKQKISNNSLLKSLSLMKSLNKDMALNMQRVKEDLSNTIAQNLSLKAELYETLMDRNCLWEKNMRLIELLRTLQAECLTFGKRIDDLLSPRDRSSITLSVDSSRGLLPDMLNQETHGDWLPNIQNAGSSPVQSDRAVHCNNFEPGILYSRKSSGAPYRHAQETNDLSPINEECEDIVTSRLGRRSRLTQNIAHMRNSGGEDAFCSVRSSLERKLSGCIIFRNRDELNESEVGAFQPVSVNEEEIDTKPSATRDLIFENMKSIEEGKSVTGRKSMAGRKSITGRKSSLAGRRNSSLLTINIMQPQSDPEGSPPVFVNVLPRKRRYASKLSLNDGFLDFGFSEETNKSEECKDYDVMDSKIPSVVLERLPIFEKTYSPISNKEGPGENTGSSSAEIHEKRKSTKKSWRPSINKSENSSATRWSFRNREMVSYKV